MRRGVKGSHYNTNKQTNKVTDIKYSVLIITLDIKTHEKNRQ